MEQSALWALYAASSDFGVALLVFAGVLVTALGTFLVARRTHSGQIRDSEAAKLWDESTNMRQELREQVEALQEETRQLKIEHAAKIAELEARVASLQARIRELEKQRG